MRKPWPVLKENPPPFPPPPPPPPRPYRYRYYVCQLSLGTSSDIARYLVNQITITSNYPPARITDNVSPFWMN